MLSGIGMSFLFPMKLYLFHNTNNDKKQQHHNCYFLDCYPGCHNDNQCHQSTNSSCQPQFPVISDQLSGKETANTDQYDPEYPELVVDKGTSFLWFTHQHDSQKQGTGYSL